MNKIGRGMVAGLIATLVLSALMVLKAMMGVMPELDLPKMIAAMMGMPSMPAVGWLVHFMIGVVIYGAAMAALNERLPATNAIVLGVIIGILGWLVMMVALMPMAGAGLFGMNLGLMAPMMTLVLHLIFGALLGWYYGRSVAHDPMTSAHA